MARRNTPKVSKISLGDIASAAGISKFSVSCALRNQPGVSKATREQILRVAKRLGYVPDARIASWMAAVRSAEKKEALPIAWMNTHSEKDAWKKYRFLTPFMEGAKARALQLGYKLDEFWCYQPGMTMKRLSQILYQRGIEGVIMTQYHKHFQIDWTRFAGVWLEGTVFAPGVHSVATDTLHNFLLAMKMLKRFGYRRIGVCIEESIAARTSNAIRAMIPYLNTLSPRLKPVAPLIYTAPKPEMWEAAKKQVIAWLRRTKPEVVIGHSGQLVECVEEAGFSVPDEMGVIHLATDDDVSDWAGIDSRRRETGAAAVELVVSMVLHGQFGLPEIPHQVLVRGKWSPGRTLQIPRRG